MQAPASAPECAVVVVLVFGHATHHSTWYWYLVASMYQVLTYRTLATVGPVAARTEVRFAAWSHSGAILLMDMYSHAQAGHAQAGHAKRRLPVLVGYYFRRICSTRTVLNATLSTKRTGGVKYCR